ncbi:MAG: hypothetical protein AB1452_13920 [Pseudomonadota bacterium]
MPLLGAAALLLSFDIAEEAIAEHDRWHTHEHLRERLSIPGFARGTRWVALRGQPRYFVMYEVEALATLTSQAYLERLNNPTPWTAQIMPHYRGMTRGLCSVTGSSGFGTGHVGLLVRFTPREGAAAALREWLLRDVLAQLPSRPGIGGAHLFESAQAPPMTAEQRIRGADAGFGWALFVTGYDRDALAGLMSELGKARFEEHGASGVVEAVYRFDYSLTDREV